MERDNILVFSHEKLYYILILMLILPAAAQHSQVLSPISQSINGFLNAICFLLLLLIVYTSRMTKKQFVLLGFACILGLLIFILLGRTFFLFYTILLIFSKDKSIDRIYKMFIWPIGIVFCFNILCTIYFAIFDRGNLYIRIMPNNSKPQLDLSCGGHPNHASLFFVVLAMLIIYKKWENLKFMHWCMLGILSVAVYTFIGSEAVFFPLLSLILWLLRKKDLAKNTLGFVIQYGILIFLCFSLIEIWVLSIPSLAPFAQWLNDMSTGRFMLTQKVLDYYPPTFLGADVKFGMLKLTPTEDIFLYADNAYVNMLVNDGAIYLVLLEGILYKVAKYLNFRELVMILLLMVYGIAETSMLSYLSMFPLLCAVCKYYERKKAISV